MISWSHHLQVYRQPRLWIIFLLGIVSGLPFLLTLSTLSFWLAESGVSKTKIGLFMLVSLPYSLKFMWAPFMDYLRLPYLTHRLGKRRSWALATQAGLLVSLISLAYCEPAQSIGLTALSSFFVAFFSASQDIVIDAYRIETLDEESQGAGAALGSIGFRMGMLASGAGALYLAHTLTWRIAYLVMATGIVLGMVVFALISEPRHPKVARLASPQKKPLSLRQWFHTLFLVPWSQLPGKKELTYLLLFIFCSKMGDTVLNAMSAPFLCDLGFSKLEFANVTKVFGITLMVLGGLSGGVMTPHLGVLQSALVCAGFQAISCLMFAIQSLVGYHLGIVMITVGVESFCSGMVAAIFVACLSHFCRQPYTATHFTLLYSFGSLCRVIISALAGWVADHVGWTPLFLMAGIFTLPAIYALARLIQVQDTKQASSFPPVKRGLKTLMK